jgi:quinoprotein glucose dehydrogenase
MKIIRFGFAFGIVAGSIATAAIGWAADDSRPVVGWPTTEGAAGGGRYSPLADIDRTNVAALEVVWTYRHGDVDGGGMIGPLRSIRGTAAESTPLVVDDRLLYTTPFSRVIALDPKTGAELWTFDPGVDRGDRFANMLINRGVGYWRESGDAENTIGPCRLRVFLASIDARLFALDAESGERCSDFGRDGEIHLRPGIEPMTDPTEYNVTSPPTVVGDVVIVGSSIADTIRGFGPPGDVRAFDARNGKLVWTFHTIPHNGEFGADTWPEATERTGHANVWSTMAADLERGWVFLPVATANPDFYGGDRKGANLFSDSVVALDAKTGERIWHFQTVHHDLWDYDLAAPPTLVDIERDGRSIPAVAQATKTGFVFVLDRETGAPLYPVEERPVPVSDVPGEAAWPTQPFPTAPPPLVPQRLTEADLWDKNDRHLKKCQTLFRSVRNEGLFTPPSEDTSLIYPFTGGGANWSGASFDPVRGYLYVPVRNLAHTIKLHPLAAKNVDAPDHAVLDSLWGGLRWITTGRGTRLRYWQDRRLLAVDGEPCNKPPWGLLVAVDLNRGTIVWRQPTGTIEETGEKGLENAGHALVTAGGLVFHGGTREKKFWAYDSDTGDVVAEFDLPAALHAGPISYRGEAGGRQLIVVAPGGHVGLDTPQGDHVIAYGLPDRPTSESAAD